MRNEEVDSLPPGPQREPQHPSWGGVSCRREGMEAALSGPVLCFPMEVRGQSLQGFFGPSWNMTPQEWLSGLLWGTSYKDRGGRGVVLQKRAN